MHGTWRMKLKGRKYLNAINKKSISREMFPHMHNVGVNAATGERVHLRGIQQQKGKREQTGNRIYKAMRYHHCHHSEG